MTTNNKEQTRIEIDLPKSKEVRKTMRVNERVWDDLTDLCDKNKHLFKKDIISEALQTSIELNS